MTNSYNKDISETKHDSTYESDYDSDYDSDYNYDSDYDYDKGYGYTEPLPGESLNDYIKRQDPELYNDMEERWNSLE